MKDFSQEQPVLVEWEDTTSPALGWEAISEITISPNICHSVGWIVKEGSGCIVVLPHLTPPLQGGQAGCGAITIPRTAVRAIKALVPSKKRKGVRS